MADIRPFHGVHYNPSLVKDLAKVICPPYDIITPQMQQELYQRSEYNFVRIEFGRELPQDKDTDNKYTRASSTLENGWSRESSRLMKSLPCISTTTISPTRANHTAAAASTAWSNWRTGAR